MKIKLIKRFVSITLSALILVSNANAFTEKSETKESENSCGYIVKFNDNANVRLFSDYDDSFSLGNDNLIVVDDLAEAKQFPPETIDYIEPNYKIELFVQENDDNIVINDTPTDPYYPEQWNMDSLGAYEAYKKGLTGEGVKVAFIDSGINIKHEDINPARIHGSAFKELKDINGHGTFSSGIVAAQTNNKKGIIGIAPNSEIYMYKAFDGITSSVADVCKAIDKAISDGCKIINMSFGLKEESISLRTAIENANDNGLLVVAAVGNSGRTDNDIQFPAGYENVIGVGSVDEKNMVSSFSENNASVDFTAPGEHIIGLGHKSSDSYVGKTDHEINNSGTSFAAPVISGMAALALEYCPEITPDVIFKLLKESATDFGIQGRDDFYGYGIVNIENFVSSLMKDYNISYSLSGGKLNDSSPTKYNMKSNAIELPIPCKDNNTFVGWYLDKNFTKSISIIPAHSFGDLKLYAKWESDVVTSISSISVNGNPAAEQINGEFKVELSKDSDISSIDLQNISVQLKNPDSAFVSSIEHDENDSSRIIIHVDSRDGNKSDLYFLNIATSPIFIKEDCEIIVDEAFPPSLDGTTEAKPAKFKEIYSWFTSESGVIPSDFSVEANLLEGYGNLSLNGQTLSYTPVPGDSGKTAIINIWAKTGGIIVPDCVTIKINIGDIPKDSAELNIESIIFDKDKYSHVEIEIDSKGRKLTKLYIDDTVLSNKGNECDYEFNFKENGNISVKLTKNSLANFSNGKHNLKFIFDDNSSLTCELIISSKDCEIIENEDGSTTTITRDDLNNTVTKKREFKDGCLAVSEEKDGLSNVNIKLTKKFSENAKQFNGGMILPVVEPICASEIGSCSNIIRVDTSKENNLKIVIPVENPTYGTVAFKINEDGSRAVIKDSLMTDKGLALKLNDKMTIEIINNSLSFTDVLDGQWYKEAVDFATARYFFRGIDSKTFAPNGTTTRCMIVTVLYRIENEPPIREKFTFNDVPENEWYTSAVQWAAENNIVNGYGNNLFAPNDPLTRQQMSALLYRYAKYKGYDISLDGDLDKFEDRNEINDYAKEPMCWAYSKGLITGITDTSIEPNGKATRAQISTILMRMIKTYDNPLS